MIRCCLLAFGLFLLLPSLFAQRLNTGDVKVRVTYMDNQAVNSSAHVRIMTGASNTALADGYTDSEGTVDFHSVPEGTYSAVVSGSGIQETNSGVFEVDPGRANQEVWVRVRRLAGEATSKGTKPVAAADLNIPKAAAQEFDKATDLIAKGNFEKAIHFLRKALTIYPRYAAVYNNLGVIYARLGQPAQERASLLKAVELNDHFAAAYANLGRLAIKQSNYPDAEKWLKHATAADPGDTQILILLANVELLNHRYDDAIAHCRKLHATQSDSHALAHYIAARALEGEDRLLDALDELETFLTEDPSGPRTEAARREITQLQARITSASR